MVRASSIITLALAATGAASAKNLRGAESAPESRRLAHLNATDEAVLRFALNLEYLEASFYSYAAYGVGIPQCKNVTGGMKANLTAATQAYAQELATDELLHVEFLLKALGASSVPCPPLDLGPAFSAAANAATGLTLSPSYSPYYSDSWFLLGAFIFEDVGVTAYNGGAGLLTQKPILQAAAGILAVEAYHAGMIRTLLTGIKDDLLTPYPLKVSAGVAAVSALRAKVGGGKDQGILTAEANSTMNYVPPTNVVPADSNAIAFARNTSEVLAIVYLGGKTSGGFFPTGLTGTIR